MTKVRTLTIELPDSIEDEEAKFMIYASLFGKGILSSGKAAELLQIDRTDFLLGLAQYGISIFSDDEKSLDAVETIQL